MQKGGIFLKLDKLKKCEEIRCADQRYSQKVQSVRFVVHSVCRSQREDIVFGPEDCQPQNRRVGLEVMWQVDLTMCVLFLHVSSSTTHNDDNLTDQRDRREDHANKYIIMHT